MPENYSAIRTNEGLRVVGRRVASTEVHSPASGNLCVLAPCDWELELYKEFMSISS